MKKFVITILLVAWSSSVYATVLENKTLVFGIVPQQSPQKIYNAWQPFINYLSKQLDVKIILRTEKSIPEFEKNLYAGRYDIAYSNPYHYTLVHNIQQHEAIVRFDKMIEGILVVNKNSKIDSINDVKNKEFLFPAPKAFAATLLTKYDILNKLNYDVDLANNYKYVNSHDSVYLGIQRGFGEVGGGIKRTFNKFKNKDQLKIIYTTDKYPSHPISVSKELDEKLVLQIKNILLHIPFEYIKPISKKTLVETSNKEYESVKDLAKKMGIFNN